MSRFLLFAAIFAFPSVASAEQIYPGYSWSELSAGIYLHSRDDPFAGPVDGNAVVIINDADIFVIDSHINPAAARAVVTKIKSLTRNPVSHIINTHWHDDHTNGNQTFLSAYPDAQIISHPYTLEKLKSEWSAFEDGRRAAYDAVTVERINEAAAAAESAQPDRAISLRIYAGYVEALKPELPDLQLAYPTLAVDGQMEFDRGDRKIVVQWIGDGNTEGDLVVWLLAEKILATGDIVVAPIPYAFDAPMLEWKETLNRLNAFDAELIIPGHGTPQKDTAYIARLASLIDATLEAVKKARADGVAYEDLQKAVSLDAQKTVFTGGDPIALNAWNGYYFGPGVSSAWISLGYPVSEGE